jgi:uridine phosphorylase
MYTAEGDEDLTRWLARDYPEIRSGITFTASGFYGPQGRSLSRLPVALPDLPERLAGFAYRGFPVLNIEMETSALLGLCQLLGHRAASLCVILANRKEQTFSEDPAALVAQLIQTGLQVVRAWE